MKALVFSSTKKLIYKTVPKPKIRKNETIIKVLATGICGSDMHAFNGLDKVKKKPPIILGHEVIGIDLHNNKYCTVNPIITCRKCENCKKNMDHLCLKLSMIGMTRPIKKNGGFAELLSIPKNNVLYLPKTKNLYDFTLVEPTAVALHAINLSKTNNPELIIAKLEYEQSEQDVKISQSDLSPSATLSFETKETDDFSSTIDQQDKETVQATVSWPLFSGGKNYAGLSKSKNLRNRKKLLLDNALRINDTNVTTAWSNMKSNASMLESVKLQVKAAQIANEGITAEYESGKGRSTLDVIQSNSILLNSQISLANSEREFLLSKFKLLQSVGVLSADHLGFNN